MNFFKLYIGDYLRDTGTLSVAEHGAYMLMLVNHYATERPLPVGKELYRLLRAESKADRDAIDSVVAKFWEEKDGGLTNRRAGHEFKRAEHQREVNRNVGKMGGRPKRKPPEIPTDPEPNGNRIGFESEPNHNPNQTPDTRHQTNTSSPGKPHTSVAREGVGGFAPPVLREDRPPIEPRDVEVPAASMLETAAICRAVRAAGIAAVQPSDPEFLALVQAGATAEEFAGHVPRSLEAQNPWRYMVRAVAGSRQRAKAISESVANGVMPPLRQAFPTRAEVAPAEKPPPRWRIHQARQRVEMSGASADPESREIVARYGMADKPASSATTIEGETRVIPARVG